MTYWTKQQINSALILGIFVLIICNIFVWQKIPQIAQNKILKVAMLDIGQGDAIYIEAPNGNQILVDGGPDKKILSELGSVMKAGDRDIDAILVTNPDRDHIGGFIPVLENFKVKYFIEPGTKNDSKVNNALKDSVAKNNLEKITARRGMKLLLDSKNNIYLDILFPDQDVSSWKTNDGSIVMKLYYGKTSMLLTGDAPTSTEEYLVKNFQNDLKSDILKVGHHGSKTSTGENLLLKTKPNFALISAGKDNQYGHPHKEIVDRLNKFGIETFLTARDGKIIFVSNGLVWQKK